MIQKIKRCYLEKKNRKVSFVFDSNKDIYEYCLRKLEENQWFETVENVFIAIAHNIFDTVLCKNCNKPLEVKKAIYGRINYCCAQCTYHNEEVRNKQKQSCLKKYGTVTPLLNDKCKEKTKKTCRQKFNNDSFAGSEQYKRRIKSPFSKEEVQQKIKETKTKRYGKSYSKKIFELHRQKIQNLNIEKYGVPYLLMNKQIYLKTNEKMKQKYGVDNYLSTQQFQKIKYMRTWKRIQSWNDFVIPLFDFEDYDGKDIQYKWQCVRCKGQFHSKIYTTGLGKDRSVPRCQNCFPLHKQSFAEKQLFDFIVSNYDGEVLKNDKSLISPYQIDIYIPEKKLAIQFDGFYWHNTFHKDKDYHLMKTTLCERNNIRMIHVFQHQWQTKKDLVKSYLKSVFGVFRHEICASDCCVKEITEEQSSKFLQQNHLFGNKKSTIQFGLYFDQELVFVMTFCEKIFNKKRVYELVRFGSKIDYNVIGSMSFLFNHFVELKKCSIISYVDRRYVEDDIYKVLGFKRIKETKPECCFYKNAKSIERFTRKELKEYLQQNYDQNLTDEQNLLLNGYNMVYDCGEIVYLFEN